MINKLTQIYSGYFDKVQQCGFVANANGNNNVITHIAEYFDNSVAKLKAADSDSFIELNNFYQ